MRMWRYFENHTIHLCKQFASKVLISNKNGKIDEPKKDVTLEVFFEILRGMWTLLCIKDSRPCTCSVPFESQLLLTFPLHSLNQVLSPTQLIFLIFKLLFWPFFSQWVVPFPNPARWSLGQTNRVKICKQKKIH